MPDSPDSLPELAADQILPLVYDELRRLAAQKLAQEKPGQTLTATALVHEAYLRLHGAQQFAHRGHFFAAAAEAMRRILVERARRRRARKREGMDHQVDIQLADPAAAEPAVDLLALHEALEELAHHDPQAAELVKLRYFLGLAHQEAAETLELSRRAADRLWALARAWLFQRLQENPEKT
jgi:RNA polymerase sigma factor (TIGR02999 family)